MSGVLLSLGTSISWGQGLRHAEKFTSIVAAELGLELRSYAHSGATLWDRSEIYPLSYDEAMERLHLRQSPAAKVNVDDGERPSRQPFVWSQLRSAVANDRPSIVVVDVGANDVDFIKQIATPGRRASEVANDIEKLRAPTEAFLRAVLAKFPSAIVVVTSYYEAFTLTSDLARSELGWFLGGVARAVVPRSAVTNSMAFRVGFDRIISGSVERIRDDRLRFAPPNFGSDNGLFTGRSMMWEPGLLGSPTDNVIAERRKLARGDMVEREVCARASIGHPNVRGARAYADAILSALR